ncbi:MAG TPA: GNAT family protein [Puia sp.]|nr:GNAT family protein [Puia sp.]
MIKLTPFEQSDFHKFMSWIESEELLITIAGTYFTYPLTDSQLLNYLHDKNSLAFNIVDLSRNEAIGHAEIIRANDGACKLDKILVGDKSLRGKGIGELIIHQLLDYSFGKLNVKEVELNVYDWNIAGIKCYEKAGFIFNHQKIQSTQVRGTTWVAKNMRIDKGKWIKSKIDR